MRLRLMANGPAALAACRQDVAAPVFRSRESEADVSGDVAVARTTPGVTPTLWTETGILGRTFVGREPAAIEQLKTLRSTEMRARVPRKTRQDRHR
jgi:hypothetical protein